jgi:hypothetical protein
MPETRPEQWRRPGKKNLSFCGSLTSRQLLRQRVYWTTLPGIISVPGVPTTVERQADGKKAAAREK